VWCLPYVLFVIDTPENLVRFTEMVERYTDETKSALELNVELKLTSELSETGMSAEWKSYDDVPRSKESARKIFKAWIGRRR